MRLLSSHSYSLPSSSKKGGLVQVLRGTEKAFFEAFRTAQADDRFFWIADEGILYAEAVYHEWKIPLSSLLIAKAPQAAEVWRLGAEAVQTGLFRSVFLKPSQVCPAASLRKLQLMAEKNQCTVFILTSSKLPHWTLKSTLSADPFHAHSLLYQSAPTSKIR